MTNRSICVFPYSEKNDYQRLSIKDFPSSYNLYKIRNEGWLPLLSVPANSYLIIDWLSPYCLSQSSLISFIKSSLFLFQVAMLRFVRRVRVVQNIHNHHDHEKRSPLIEHALQAVLALLCHKMRFFSHCSAQSYINEYGGRPKSIVIYHPLYERGARSSEKKKYDLIFFGNIRAYKGILRYLNTPFLDRLSANSKTFLVAGSVHNSIDINDYQINHPCLESSLNFISDEQLREFIAKSKFAFLPYEEITTSGALYLAISCNIPVIVKRLPFFTEILGPDYPFFFDAESDILRILNGEQPDAGIYKDALQKVYSIREFIEGAL